MFRLVAAILLFSSVFGISAVRGAATGAGSESNHAMLIVTREQVSLEALQRVGDRLNKLAD